MTRYDAIAAMVVGAALAADARDADTLPRLVNIPREPSGVEHTFTTKPISKRKRRRDAARARARKDRP